MKKMALITLHNVKNYGSVLQTYATQYYFEQMGYEVITIDYRRPWETSIGYWFYMNEKSLKGLVRNIVYIPSKIIQNFRFNKFLNDRIHLSERIYKSEEDLIENPISADIYCTGSDQVWNSGWNEGIIPAYFLSFIKKHSDSNIKKISFSASFGNSNLSDTESKEVYQYLRDYDLITVREKKSAEMLKDKLKLNAYEILDPTLQISGDFWKLICSSKRLIKRKYVLLIQLNRNYDFDNIAVDFAKKKNIILVRLCLRIDQVVLPGKKVIIPKVEDYISLIRDSEYVLTDSFHALSFCLNLNKQFYCYFPEKYSERLKSILELTGLEARAIIGKKCTFSDKPIDFSTVNKFLEQKREYAKEILRGV